MKRIAKVKKDKCVSCGCCLKVCRLNAITLDNGVYAEIDKNKCVGCKMCINACPAAAIEEKEVNE